MALHSFFLKADWPGGRNSVGEIEASNLKTEVSIPPEMDGPGIGTNPDEMLLGAAATCYIITLAAMLERASIPVSSLSMESEGIVEVEQGVITYKTIIHRPRIILPQACEQKQINMAGKLAEKAEKSCMISRALAGNVEIKLKTDISVGK
ncbi:OsmC family protein [Lederbergia citrea]|uniref:OsmC family protein n=1 Tax=Lederbergia citrea TaxID=2833581 RepID=A0A942UKJ9_9BACI|nr:OsmC family protein [Lederbergia citrea]MBS4177331.1 OsmC family protein [Lederbergia citrea]MBS4203994.1 OsmC family protein [Lederbergia citrea]MBS4221422.1 OsmC family protein [Lederbergia citrea]